MNIKTTPIEKYMDLNNRPTLDEYEQFNANWYSDGYPRQYIGDKLARSSNFNLISHPIFDQKNKSFTFEYVKNAKGEVQHSTLEYSDICKLLSWKSFSYNATADKICPVMAPLKMK